MERIGDYAGSYQGQSALDRRSQFIVRTYNHLFGAIVAFALIEVALFQLGVGQAANRFGARFLEQIVGLDLAAQGRSQPALDKRGKLRAPQG